MGVVQSDRAHADRRIVDELLALRREARHQAADDVRAVALLEHEEDRAVGERALHRGDLVFCDQRLDHRLDRPLAKRCAGHMHEVLRAQGLPQLRSHADRRSVSATRTHRPRNDAPERAAPGLPVAQYSA